VTRVELGNTTGRDNNTARPRRTPLAGCAPRQEWGGVDVRFACIRSINVAEARCEIGAGTAGQENDENK
jgi:hypothetical protein